MNALSAQICPTVFGDKLFLRQNDFISDCIKKSGHCLGIEIVLINALLKALDQPIAFDVGANIGTHGIPMSKFCEQVYMFEPQPDNIELIKKSLNLNVVNNATVCEFGLSDSSDDAILFVNLDGNNGSSTLLSEISQQEFKHCHKIEVPLRQGDAFVKDKKIPHVDLIKIDVEGFEGRVIEGLKETIARERPFIILEWTTTQAKADFQKFNLMKALFKDYSVKAVKDDKYMHRVNTRKHKLRFLTRFIYKLLHRVRYVDLQSFEFDDIYISILLYPNEKRDIVEKVWQSKAILPSLK